VRSNRGLYEFCPHGSADHPAPETSFTSSFSALTAPSARWISGVWP
jgi:hypothetical protein